MPARKVKAAKKSVAPKRAVGKKSSSGNYAHMTAAVWQVIHKLPQSQWPDVLKVGKACGQVWRAASDQEKAHVASLAQKVLAHFTARRR